MRMKIQYGIEPPKQGRALICFRTRLYYGAYRIEEDELELEESMPEMAEREQREILEMHLFDENREYRRLYSQAQQGYLESVVSDQEADKDLIITENCFVLPEYAPERKISVVSYLRYDENDMLELVNYRLGIARGGHQDE